MRSLAGKLPVYVAAACLALAHGSAHLATAQAPPGEPPKPPSERSPLAPSGETPPAGPAVQEAKPETFYLIDKDGKLIPFFDIPFEEFRRLYLLDRKLKTPDQPPRFALQQMVALGSVEGSVATLDVTFRVLLNESGWTRVPLRLNNAILLSETVPRDEQPRQFVEFDKGTDGYVAWVQGEKGTSQTMRLKFLLALEQVAGEYRMALQAPLASAAELRLKVPQSGAVADPIDGVILQPPRKLSDGRTELHFLGLSGDANISWREARETAAKTPPILEASGATLLRFVGQGRVSAECRLRVRSLNVPIDTFLVRLPVGLKLIPTNQPRYSAVVVDGSSAAKLPVAGAPQGQLVEVKLSTKTTEAVEVLLLAELTRSPAGAAATWEAAGFEVLGAISQWGHVELAVEGDWLLSWVEGAQVQRVSEAADAAARQAVARFEYSRQPYSLKVQVLPKRTRVSVEPIYLVHVEARQARLEARLKYRVRGASPTALDVDLSDWKLDASGLAPENLLALENLASEQVAPLRIPLAPAAQTSGGEFEIRLTATRELTPSEKFSLTLPRPVASAVTPAVVVLMPADNIELMPVPADLTGLVPEALPPSLSLPAFQQPPLVYRDRSESAAARFVGQFKIREGAVSVSAASRIQIGERAARIEQRLLYRVSYEPIAELDLEIPRDLLMARRMEFTFEGQPLTPEFMEDETAGELGNARAIARLDLRGERIGPCEIVVAYEAPLPKLEAGKSVELHLPLVTPAHRENQTLRTNSLQIAESFQAIIEQSEHSAWTAFEDAASGGEGRLFAPVDTPELILRVSPASSQRRGGAVVRGAWLQTWLSERERRDRAVFRLAGAGPIKVQLPSGVRLDDLELAFNGRRVSAPRTNSAGQLEFELGASPDPQESVLEIWYSFEAGRPAVGSVSVEMPSVVGAVAGGRTYWQLVLPRGEHLIGGPAGMIPELAWRRSGLLFIRQASLGQAELERWSGASVQAPLPGGVNEYLFSSFAPLERVAARTAARLWILLGVSAGVLALGIPLLYFPLLRHPAALLVLAVAVSAAGLFDPDAALQIAQIAVLGVVLLLLARVFRWVLTRRHDRRAIIRGASILGLDSTDSRRSRRDVDSRVSTATAPLTIPVPAEARP